MDKMTPDAVALNRSSVSTPVSQPGRSPPRLTGAMRRAILTRTVQLDVIPQLLRRPAVRGPGTIAGVHVSRLATLALGSSSGESIDFLTGLLENGFEAERLYLDLLAPTAALLGKQWEDDTCSFADVTLGIGVLQTAMRALNPAFLGNSSSLPVGAPRALLMPLPGEQHTFGLSMLTAFFIRGRWDVWSGQAADTAELRNMVQAEWVDVVGFSIACDAMLDVARREIASVRAASQNGAVVVMVGGPPFAMDPSLAGMIGADGTARDGTKAVALATKLLPRYAGRP